MNDRDRALVQRICNGEPDLFGTLVEPYVPRLFNLVAHLVGDHSVAEDVLQDVLLSAFRSLSRFRGESGFYTWVYRIAVNRSLNWIRRVRGRFQFESLDEPILTKDGQIAREVVDWRENPESRTEQSEMMHCLEEAIAGLSEANRIVFTLR